MTAEQFEDLLYAIGQESQTAHEAMKAICQRTGASYPPQPLAKEQQYQFDRSATSSVPNFLKAA